MTTNPEDVLKRIRDWKKGGGAFETPFGALTPESEIGQGGAAIVFACSAFRGSAIKVLTENVAQNKPTTRYERFLAEYCNLLTLAPTGAIVPLYYFGVQQLDDDLSVPFIVMERCMETLHDCYAKTRLKDKTELVGLLQRLLSILEVVHNAGIVHRDLKPKNILKRPNGDWVLADFGIAWFDDDMHEFKVETKAGDRLANFEFSAPEMVSRSKYAEKVPPNIDLYSLGQIIYHCITGETIRGTHHKAVGELESELSFIDPLIDNLVRQVSDKRLQSVSEVRAALDQALHPRSPDPYDDSNSYNKHYFMSQQYADEFDSRIRRALPKIPQRGYYQARNAQEIRRVLESLAADPESMGLYWTLGMCSLPVKQFVKLPEATWLIDPIECEVVDLWIYRHPRLQRQYIVLHLAPMRPFFDEELTVHEEDELDEVTMFQAGYWNGRYVSLTEMQNGYAEIDGKVVQLESREERWRNPSDEFLILAPSLSTCISCPTSDDTVVSVRRELQQAGQIVEPALKPLESFEIEDLWMPLMRRAPLPETTNQEAQLSPNET